jgi:hypothetical protein
VVDILQQSFAPNILWQMVSAIAAVFTLVAVLFLPVINRCLIDRRNHKAVLNELYANKRCMQQISDLWRQRADRSDGTSGYEYEVQIKAAALRISCDSWDNFKHELKPDVYKCLLPFFTSCYDVIDPNKHVAHGSEESLHFFQLIEAQSNSANEFLEQFAATAPKCRYLRQT